MMRCYGKSCFAQGLLYDPSVLSYLQATKAAQLSDTLKLRLERLLEPLVLGELVVVVETLRIEQGTGWFDDFARDDLLYRQFHFLQIHRCLDTAVSIVKCISNTQRWGGIRTGISGVSNTYFGTWRGLVSFRIAALTSLTRD